MRLAELILSFFIGSLMFAAFVGAWIAPFLASRRRPAGRAPIALRRPRLTVRRLMIAVAALAVVLGLGVPLERRSERFRAIAEDHVVRAMSDGRLVVTEDGPAVVDLTTERGRWHESMYRKYEHAARYPFLIVAPDPPEPE